MNTIAKSETSPTPSGGAPDDQPLYAERQKPYPRSISGTFRNIKWWALWVLLGIYWLAPWLRWYRGPTEPSQAILIDLPARRAYFFFIEIWPQEVYYLTGLLILAAVGLFLATALFGRVWCGFACFQTVWTDLYIWVERLVEGDRNARLRLDRGPLTGAKVVKKLVKHGLWILIAAATGGAFVQYFANAPTLVPQIFTGHASETVYLFIASLTFSTYLMAGWAREQICIYMCPYPRFQAAMFDEHSLLVSYEDWRGEPRSHYRKGDDFSKRGHCVDCRACVDVCPTGTDIRRGSQLSCIGCALCIDACNAVMDRFKLPRGLISYDSYDNMVARSHGRSTKLRLIRPRTLFYVAIIALVSGIMVFSLATRRSLEVNLLRDRNPLYVMLSSGEIQNGYTFKILNMDSSRHHYTLTTEGLTGGRMFVIGQGEKPTKQVDLEADSDDVNAFRVFVRAPAASVHGKEEVPMVFVLTDTKTHQVVKTDTTFVGPGKI